MPVEPGPIVSVIIPVYNGAAFLRLCLEAVVATDYASYECIVVDDGSTDDSRTIAAQFPMPVRVVDISDGPRGPAHARNRGDQRARGELLIFVDVEVVFGSGVF